MSSAELHSSKKTKKENPDESKYWKFVVHLDWCLSEAEALEELEIFRINIRHTSSEWFKHGDLCIFQLERGEKNGNFHIQGWIRLAYKLDYSWMKNFGFTKIFIRSYKSTEIHDMAYAQKDTDHPGGRIYGTENYVINYRLLKFQ